MFTGIVTDIGRVRSITATGGDRRYEIETRWDTAGFARHLSHRLGVSAPLGWATRWAGISSRAMWTGSAWSRG